MALNTSLNLLDKKDNIELVLELPSFAGGENTIGADQELKANEARVITNWDSFSLGGMIRTPGFTQIVDQTATYASQGIDCLLHHYEGTTVRNYAIVNSNLTRLNGTALTTTDAAAFTAGKLTGGLTASNTAYFTNSTDNIKYTTIGGSIAVPTTTPPNARDRLYFHQSRLIAEGGGVTVYGSRAGGASTWNGAGGWTTSGDAWSIDMPDLTQGCVPGFPASTQVTCFTERSTYVLYNFPNIAYSPVNVNRGCSAPYSISYGKEGVFFLSKFPTLGVFLWDGTTFTDLTIYETWKTDINFSNRIFGVYRENKYRIMYSSTTNAKAYPDTCYEYDVRFGRWAQRAINTSVSDTFGYPAVIVKPSNLLYVGSPQKGKIYQLESGNADVTFDTQANYKTKDFSSKDFSVQGQGNLPIDEVRMKLIKMTVTYYGSIGLFTVQWNSDRGLHAGQQTFDLTAKGDLINTTFIVNQSYLSNLPPTRTMTRSFNNSAIGKRFSFQVLNNGTGDRAQILKIKIFAICLDEE